MKKRLFALFLVLILLVPAAMASAAYYRVNTSKLKIRRLPSANAKVLDTYRRDWALTINQKFGDWSYIIFTNGKDGYCQTKYLKKSSSYSAWITTNDTHMRYGPDYSFKTVGVLARGTKVTVLSHGTNYDYISTKVGNGYVKNSFLSKKKVKPTGGESTVVEEPVSEGIAGVVVNPNGGSVNLRRGAGEQYPVISSFKPGTRLTILTKGSKWCKVKISGATGYMMTKFISTEIPQPVMPSPAGDPTPDPQPTPPYTAYITSANGKSVNIHTGPGLGYANVCRLKVGTVVTVKAWRDAKWSEIQIGSSRVGFVLSVYLTTDVPSVIIDPDAELPTTPPPTFPYTAYVFADNGLSVNIHMGPGLGYSNVCQLKVGTEVSVLNHYSDKWYKISFNDGKHAGTGYILSKYLKLTK